MQQFNDLDCPYPVIQGDIEFHLLLQLFTTLNPAHILEIGSLHGGTLFQWMKQAQEGAKIMSIDLLVSPMDSRYRQQLQGHDYEWLWHASQFGHEFCVLNVPSADPFTCFEVKEFLGTIDFLFIDGDHTYNGVRSDFLMYRDLVMPGGLIAFHDIKRHTAIDEVWQLWDEIKSGKYGAYKMTELVSEPDQQDWGIGVLQAC